MSNNKLSRLAALNAWLRQIFATTHYELAPASADASFRSYYRAKIRNHSYIVMDAPPEHENIALFIDITNRLQKARVHIPFVFAKNIEQGFALMSDFGNHLYLDQLTNNTADSLYQDAICALVNMQSTVNTDGLGHYGSMLFNQEMALFDNWLLKAHLRMSIDVQLVRDLNNIYCLLEKNASEQPQVFTHRDYHSRNLMMTDHFNPGIIDYQDALMGPISYDLVSLLKDCYIKWSRHQQAQWIDFYLDSLQRKKPGLVLSSAQFQRWFDLMGVQRHLKASGIFARLFRRDGKPGFLQEIPRTLSYIIDLKKDYPELTPLFILLEEKVLPLLSDSACTQ